MTQYATLNPLGSTSPYDLFDNAQNLDFAVNSYTATTWQDRFNKTRLSWYGIEQMAREAIAAFGYITMDSFQAGATLNLPNQVLRDTSTGEYYRWDGAFPKTVPAGSTPASTGGISIGAWLGVGDAVLRGNLAAADGYKYIGEVSSFNALRTLRPTANGVRVKLRGYYFGSTDGGGDFIGKTTVATDDGGTIAAGTDFHWERDGEGFRTVLMFGAKRDGVTSAQSAFLSAAAACPGGVYVPSGTYLIPADISGKYFGPGRRITTAGDTISIPFSNPAQSHGNLFWGYDAGKNYAGDDISGQVVAVGPGAARNVSTGYNITVIGAGCITGDTLNDALTDTSLCTGNELIAIGVNALKKAITLNNSIGIGRDALNENKFGSFNIGIGSSALQQLHTGSGNVALGRAAGMRSGIITDAAGIRLSFSTVNGCTFLGNAAGRENQSGNNNTNVGNNSGRGVTSTTNTFTGTITGSNNTSLGADSLNKISSGSNNLALGYGALRDMATGSGNIAIGPLSGASITSGDNQFIVANQGSLPYLQGLMAGPLNASSYLRVDGVLTPAADNTRALGSGGYRWTQVFAATGAINTSDGRFKTDISAPTETELRVARKLKSLIVRYKFIDAVEEKSGDARWHFGVIAQEVEKAFSEEGLNASDYGLFCYDEWEDQYETIPAEVIYHPAIMSSLVSPDGEPMMVEEERWEVIKPAEKVLVKEAGGRYGIRYEELLALIIAAL